MPIGKYSIVAFNNKLIHGGGFYVEDIENGLLKLSGFPRMVDPREVHALSQDDLKTEHLVAIHDQLQILASLYLAEIRRRATDTKRNKLNSKYFYDNFEVKKKVK